MKSEVECSLVVNVARADVPILEHTIPHIISSHKVRFAEVLIVIDEIGVVGRLGKQQQYSVQELTGALDRLQSKGYQFQQVTVDGSSETAQHVFGKWFDQTDISFRCAGGTPIYAFLFGLEQARCDYRLHLDADMLIFDPSPQSWVQHAITILQDTKEVLFVNQAGGPHHDRCPRPEHIAAFDERLGLHADKTFSTRCFLYSDRKLQDHFLPIVPARHPVHKRVKYKVQRRSSYLALEQMIARGLGRSTFLRCDLQRAWGFNLHAGVDKSVFLDPRIDDIITRIQLGDAPAGQCGYYDLVFESFCEPE